MSGASFHITVKAGERIYVNGAVMRFNCKVTVEFMNDVTFLLESHVMLPEQATSPLRQLYFAAQTILMEPSMADAACRVFRDTHALIRAGNHDEALSAQLQTAHDLVIDNRVFEALKLIRALFAAEHAALTPIRPVAPTIPANIEATL